jgi:hypothetical protein
MTERLRQSDLERNSCLATVTKRSKHMQNRYGYFKRVNGVYYVLDLQSQRQSSLNT